MIVVVVAAFDVVAFVVGVADVVAAFVVDIVAFGVAFVGTQSSVVCAGPAVVA